MSYWHITLSVSSALICTGDAGRSVVVKDPTYMTKHCQQ